MRLLLTILLLAGCGHTQRTEPVGGYQDPELLAKGDFYSSLLPRVSDPDGFIEVDKCDSVHFSALLSAATIKFNVRAAVDDVGKLHRRPLRYKECYPDESKSENSRDAYLMVLAYILAYEDLDLAETFFSYGQNHSWVMGAGELSRTAFTPNMQAMYALAIQHLGGKSYPERLYKIVLSANQAGYAAHLEVLTVLLLGKINGYIDAHNLGVLKNYYHKQPHNPLFAAAYYRYSGNEEARMASVATLKDERLFPSDRLPESKDRCEQWLVQRDEGDDWQPCPEEGRTHSGGDFLFTEAVLAGRF
jgi:hypothetical protein